MKIALVNIFKPEDGSGDGITEYTYQLYKKLRHKHKIDLFFALDKSKRVDVPGRIYAETIFKLAAKEIIAGDYDIVHITNPEIGYFAKKLKNAGVRAKTIVTIHDFVRVVSHSKGGSGGLQGIYDSMIAKNVADAVNYSDFIIFTSNIEMRYASDHYQRLPRHSLILIGAKDLFLNAPIHKRSRGNGKPFTVGYIGGLVESRHIEFILKTAEALDHNYNFKIYGTGSELPELLKYKADKKLQNVQFMGFAPEKKLLDIYDGFDAFMNCSSVDVASLPIEDALARGLPVIIAKNNIYDTVVKDRVYQAANPGNAATIIEKLRKNGYPTSRQKSIIKFAKTISWANVARTTESVYKNIAKNKS